MNESPNRRRILLLCAVGGVLLLGLLFISLRTPAPGAPHSSPVLRPAGSAEVPASLENGSGAFSLGAGDIVSLAWRRALVIVILGVSVAGLRWWGRKSSGPRSPTGFLRVVDTLPIGNGRTIHLVSLGDRVIAIGATAQSVAFLTNLSDDESARVLAPSGGPAEQSLASFATELFQSMRRGRAVDASADSDTRLADIESPFA